MGHIPSRLVRWGISVIFLIFIGILVGSCFITVPETISGILIIKTDPAPENVAVSTDGILDTLLCNNHAIVKTGTPIAWLRNETSYTSITLLQDYLKEFSDSNLMDTALLRKSKALQNLDIELQTRLDILINAYETLHLYKNTAHNNFYQYEQHLYNLRNSVREANIALSSCILDRVKTCLLIAPTSGEIIYISSSSSRIKTGDIVASILPITQSPIALYGEMVVIGPSCRKLQIGQSVRIDLKAFPDLQKNILSGMVSDLAPLTEQEGCRIRVVFSNGTLSLPWFRYSKNISAPAKITISTPKLIQKLIHFQS